MILREATPADRDQVIAMALRFHAETAYAQLLQADPDRIAALFDVSHAHGVVYVAEAEHSGEGGELVGFIAFVACIHQQSGERFASEQGWWVNPIYRTGSLGRQLLALAEAWAKADGCFFIAMIAPVGMDAVGHVYERRGYVPVETTWMKRVA